jgi:hypothetical protein
MMMRRRFVLLASFLIAGSLLAADAPVTVHVTPAKIHRRTFDPSRPPADMPRLTPPEVGQCVYEFGCEMEMRVVHSGAATKPLRARITGTTFTTQLTITVWTPRSGHPGVVEHEEGHREISEYYYRPAREIARRLGERLTGTWIDAPSSGEQALQARLRELQNRVIKAYLAETLTRCSYAQQRFDVLTDHSRSRVPVREAIDRAIAEEKRFYATRVPNSPPPPGPSRSTAPKRSPPTRPRA